MKNTELRRERDAALFRSYIAALENNDFRLQRDAVNFVRTHAAPKFFVSPTVCAVFMCRMMKGRSLGNINFLARKKFEELFRRFIELRSLDAYSSVTTICERLVEQPAPEFYIGYDLARSVINREMRRHHDTVAQRYRK